MYSYVAQGQRDKLDKVLSWHPALWCVVFAAVVLVSGISIGLVLFEMRQNTLLIAKQDLSNALNLAANSTHSWIQEINEALSYNERRVIEIDASHQDLHDPEIKEVFRNGMIQQMALVPSVISMSVFDAKGDWTISSRFKELPDWPPLNGSERPLWKAALRTMRGTPFILGPRVSPTFGVKTIVIGRPARAQDGRMLGAVLAFLSVETLYQPFSVLVTSERKVLLGRSDGSSILGLDDKLPEIPAWLKPQWQKALERGGTTFENKDENGQKWIGVVSGSPKSVVTFTIIETQASVLRDWIRYSKIVFTVSAIGIAGGVCLFVLWLCQRRQSYLKGLKVIDVQHQMLSNLAHDPVTALLNRSGLEQELSVAWKIKRPVALHIIGIDRFEALLNVLGHDTIDLLFGQLGDRVRSILNSADLPGRLSQASFCVVQHDGDPKEFSDKIMDTLGQPYTFGEKEIRLGISIGIVPTTDESTQSDLFLDGIGAMHRARQSNRASVCWFEPALDRPLRERLAIEQDFQAAIGTDQLYMVYQPIYDLVARKIVGFEALMRWAHPVRGLISPAVFIPIAERNGLLLPFDQMVKSSPLSAVANWPEDISVSINLSALDFRDPTLPDRLRERLNVTNVAPRRCIIEVTESAVLADDDLVVDVMRMVKSLGVRLALDDFGTGHASMSYLQRFPFDRIKIDRSFVEAMDTSDAAAAIIDATMALSRRLNLEVVAEGVSLSRHIDRLREVGCPLAQGYLISRPMPEAEVESFLTAFSPASEW